MKSITLSALVLIPALVSLPERLHAAPAPPIVTVSCAAGYIAPNVYIDVQVDWTGRDGYEVRFFPFNGDGNGLESRFQRLLTRDEKRANHTELATYFDPPVYDGPAVSVAVQLLDRKGEFIYNVTHACSQTL